MLVFATTAFTISSLITQPSPLFVGQMLEVATLVVKRCRLIYTG